MGTTKKALAGLILAVEGLGAFALALGGLVVNGWWVNEGQVNVATYPWWSVAGKTFAAWLPPIAVFSACAWAANRWMVGTALGLSQRATRRLSAMVLVVSASGSILGALWFGLFKPHM